MNSQSPRSIIESMSTGLDRRDFLQSLGAGFYTALASGILAHSQLSAATENVAPASRQALPTALVTDELFKLHDTGPDHPESIQRYAAVRGALEKMKAYKSLKLLKPRAATGEELRLCHTEAYLNLAKQEIESGADHLSTGDTAVCRQSLNAALHAAGGVCVAVDAVMGSGAKNAFCVSRPPGHHATADRGMGFCVFNNVAVAARYAQQKHKIGKVLIVDWDVHHGNGTQDIFYEDGSVFFFSTHQSPWYPWTGAKEETGRGRGKGTTLNCPFAAGAKRKEFVAAIEAELLPAMQRFKPELVLISAGFDARQGDPLGELQLTDEDFGELTGLIMRLADEHAQSRVVSVLEGGYNLTGLASAAAAHCTRLVG